MQIRKRTPAALRFWAKVDKTESCWEWTGSKDCAGYGKFKVASYTSPVRAPRFAYELVRGPITDGLHVCHACDNPACVRPDHLWLGTAKDNAQDKSRKGRCPRPDLARTHCIHGHELTPENIVWQKGTSKSCRTCYRNHWRAFAARRRSRSADLG